MQTITLYMRRMSALQFIGMNDVLQLQLLIKKANGYLDKLRLAGAPACGEFLEHTCRHLRECEHILYEPALSHVLRFALAKQRAISALQLLQLRGQLQYRQDHKTVPLVRVIGQAGFLPVALAYIAPVCCN